MSDWFTIEHVDENTHIISEYKHWEESHAYLLHGDTYSLLIDTGLGIKNIHSEVLKWTDKPVIAVATHVHWDHIGGHEHFPVFYAHEAELHWLNGEFPLTIEQVKSFVAEDCERPDDFDVNRYTLFQGMPARILHDNDVIDLGGRRVQVLHTPGHSPGHMCFWEERTGYLFTGDLVYRGTLFAYFPSTDPAAYLASMERVAALPVKRVLPAHHDLGIPTAILGDIHAAFLELARKGKLQHGSGTHRYENFSIQL